jgi:hypothetical protein
MTSILVDHAGNRLPIDDLTFTTSIGSVEMTKEGTLTIVQDAFNADACPALDLPIEAVRELRTFLNQDAVIALLEAK